MSDYVGKAEILNDLQQRVTDKILEPSNYALLEKLVQNADTLDEAIKIAELGTTYRRTGFHFDKKLERQKDDIAYFKKNEQLSFETDKDALTHKLIIGDNYPALLNLLVEYKGRIDIIYIDPPYGKDSMGEFAQTNYENAISRDNLLSMLYPRLWLAKQLLSETGVIFCSIDDKNQAYVKGLFDEVFGESAFLLNVARITKKGGKSTQTIAKNTDYVLAYTVSNDIIFSQEEKDTSKYIHEDEFVDTRGKYALSQTLDYNSLQYSKTMDYEIEIEGQRFVPGGNKRAQQQRLDGHHGVTDWVWRWSKSAVEWGIHEKAFVLKNNRIYTKSYMNCRKKNGKNEWEFVDPGKAYTTLSYIDNRYSNDNGKKELDGVFNDGSTLFKNPKPTALVEELIKMVSGDKEAIILDFFAGSGTTGQAVLELNRDDKGSRQFILATTNEVTDTTPNGVVYDVTSRRLKRVMSGEDYDGSKDFKWREKHEPLGDNLLVVDIAEVANFETTEGKTPFDVIDETLYGQERLTTNEKVAWVCKNFEDTQKRLEDR